jgi:pimeloyl-ACP methyl ester carboxylesterase
MHTLGSRLGQVVLAAIVTLLASALIVSSARAMAMGRIPRVTRMIVEAPPAPGTPTSVPIPQVSASLNLNKVGILEIAPRGEKATNVLVLEPGTSAAAAYFVPFAKSLVEAVPGWQVWAVERRENFLESQKMLNRYKSGSVSSEAFFNYYLGYLAGKGPRKKHYKPVPKSSVGFAKNWGMSVAVEDLNVVIQDAKKLGGKVVLGGHSLGGSVVTAYATWDFNGQPGAQELAGLVYDDGGSNPSAITKEEAEKSLAQLDEPGETPWLAFGGIPAPDLGLFSATSSALTLIEPNGPSLLEKFPFLPSDLRGPITPVTNEAGFGFGVNVGTSPTSLAAAQVHAGSGVEPVAEADGLHGWNGSGALTPIRRYAEMLAGAGLKESGSEWYFPARLTLDTRAVGNGLANPAQEVLGLRSTEGEHLPKSLRMLAIDSELDSVFGTGTVLDEAVALATQSGIPSSNLTLIEVKSSYAHNDPAGATPGINEFFKHLAGFLEEIAK